MARAPDSPRKASSAKAPALPPSMRERVPFLLYRAAETSHSLANTMLAEIAFLVHPTDSGRLAKLDAVRILDEQQHRFLEPLTIAERRVGAGLLRRLYEGIASGPA